MANHNPKGSTLNTQQALSLALQHHQAGRLDQAADIYQRILAADPNHTPTLNLLGILESIRGNKPRALELLRRASAAEPNNPNYHNNLGITLRAMGQHDQAADAYQEALRLNPNYAEAYNGLGNVFKEQNKPTEALVVYQIAVKLKPDYAEGHNNLANMLKDQGHLQQAMEEYRLALKYRPNAPPVHQNLGIVLQQVGQSEQAAEEFRTAIKLKPDYAEAHNMLGVVLAAGGDYAAALQSYQKALEYKPDYAETHNNLGNLYRDRQQVQEAIAQYQLAIGYKPDLAEAHNNLANALNDQGRISQAIAAFRAAIKLEPQRHQIHSNLIFTMHLDPASTAQDIHRELLNWNQRHAEPLKKFILPHTNHPDPERRLRIGYVSADFRQHVVGWNLLPLFREHHHELLEICCYSFVKTLDSVTQNLRSHTDVWREMISMGDQQAAQMIRDDKIDILVDLALHTGHNRLLVFAYKPAPVQVTWLGYAGSTGLETMDYRFSDPYLDPPDTDLSVYSEQTLRLPETYWCYQPGGETPQVAPLPALAAGYVTLGCLNNFAKVSPATVDLWLRILREVSESRLIVHAKPGAHQNVVRERLKQNQIATERLEFLSEQSWEKYIDTYNRIDMALDPFPYNGGITTFDSLYMGVPVISLEGKTAVGRAGKSLLSNVGLPELIADTPEEYVQIAVKLAGDLPRLSELRKTLRGRMEASPLMDAKRFARNIEAAYREMWRRWCAKT